MPHAPDMQHPPRTSAHRAHGKALVVLVVALAVAALLVVVLLRSEAFALRLIARAAGERAMALASGPDRCCDTSHSSVQLGFSPLRIEIFDFELRRHDPAGERGGSAVLADIPLLALHLDAGALWSNRPALESVAIGDGIATIKASEGVGGEVWRIDLKNLSLALFGLVFSGADDLSGVASGEVEIAGSLFAPDSVEVDLEVASAAIRIKRFDIRGKVVIEGDLARAARGLEGGFDIDVREAEVNVQNAYRKPAGTAGSISGRLASGPSGQIEASDFNYQAKKARVQIEL